MAYRKKKLMRLMSEADRLLIEPGGAFSFALIPTLQVMYKMHKDTSIF